METKTFSRINSMAMVLTSTVAALSIFGIVITGLYPGILVLCFIALIPIASKFYTKKESSDSNDIQRHYTSLTILNVLASLVAIWMSFVILVDRIFSKVL